MTSLATVVPHDNEEVWQEARRPVVTATQVRDWAKGYASDRARLIIEKVTGVREDLAAIKYIEWGKFREPYLQDWVAQKYGIAPVANDLYVCGDEPRWACTPDGYSDAFGIITLSELKTSKHDLAPDTKAFLESGYEDQMLWEMRVTGAVQVLFVWEQHDDLWNPWPTPYPPQAVWIPRDERRIQILEHFAEELLEHVARWQEAYQQILATCTGEAECAAAQTALVAHVQADYTKPDGLEARWLFTVGGDLVKDTDPLAMGVLTEDLAELAEVVIQARADEAAAKKRKEEAWKKIGELTREHGDFKAARGGYAVGWTTSTSVKSVLNIERMRAKAPAAVARYEALVARYTEEVQSSTRTMTVTKQD
jgi:hypothetical protein